MNTKQMTQEQISAFADGELADQHVEIALAALRQRESRADWELYHQIGDVLRSDDMAIGMSPGFAARMAQRLEAEPSLVAPAALAMPAGGAGVAVQAGARKQFQLWSLPNMVGAAAVAAIAFVTTPTLLLTMKGEPVVAQAPAQVVTSREATPQTMPDLRPAAQLAAGTGAQPAAQSAVIAAQGPDGVVLRDARIDDYLWAHQRFSPSVYSSAQFARSATFATDSSK